MDFCTNRHTDGQTHAGQSDPFTVYLDIFVSENFSENNRK